MLDPEPVTVRHGQIADAAAIADVHVRTWQVAYRGLIPDSFLDRIDLVERRERWQQITEQAEYGGQCLLVAHLGEVLVGFATGGPSRDADPVTPQEVYAIYVDPGAWGGPAADGLMIDLLEDLGARHTSVCLWVLSDNHRARGFYARHGFVPDGAVRTETFDGIGVLESRLVRQPR